jgi:hypothetical protein
MAVFGGVRVVFPIFHIIHILTSFDHGTLVDIVTFFVILNINNNQHQCLPSPLFELRLLKLCTYLSENHITSANKLNLLPFIPHLPSSKILCQHIMRPS